MAKSDANSASLIVIESRMRAGEQVGFDEVEVRRMDGTADDVLLGRLMTSMSFFVAVVLVVQRREGGGRAAMTTKQEARTEHSGQEHSIDSRWAS